ncbi:acyl-[acyl-carrier-protein] thioesterase [Coprobacter fastidiosus]|uniref:acyl-[acyl-carrier-protein] thioesterase n=1 Tax=Coprobacter fastidiosus TaxID=1099853 RepID=UPI0022E1BD0A|nr:acyl-ACP thioesterase domain-containing protein [Coprobacter fastidiosus]
MENEQKKIAAYIYDLEPAEGNAQQEIPLTLLVKRILETATYHAENWGVGYSTLIKENRAWVLARLAIEMSSYPGIYDKYKIETWIESYNKHFSARNFCFSSPDGKLYGYARSIWSVIDIQNRTSVDITTFRHIENNVGEKDCPIAPQSKIKQVNDENPIIYPIRYSDIDINRHINSVKYIEHILDMFSMNMYDKNFIRRFEINYINEARYGDKLSFYREQLAENIYTSEIRNSSGETICRGRIEFSERN